MASWILANHGQTVVVGHPSPEPALISITTSGGGAIDNLANAFFLSEEFGRKVNHEVAKTLSDVSYYTAFGVDSKPLRVGGLIFEPTCDGSGSAYRKLYSFFSTYKAVNHDSSHLRVTVDSVLHRALLVDYTISHAVGDRDIPIYPFQLEFVVLSTTT